MQQLPMYILVAAVMGGCSDPTSEGIASAGESDLSRSAWFDQSEILSGDVLSRCKTWQLPQDSLQLLGLYRTAETFYGDLANAPRSEFDDDEGMHHTQITMKHERVDPIEFFADATDLRKAIRELAPIGDATQWEVPEGIGLAIRLCMDGHLVLCFQGVQEGRRGLPAGPSKDGATVSFHAIDEPESSAEEPVYRKRAPGTLQLTFGPITRTIFADEATVEIPDGPESAGSRILVTELETGDLLLWSAIPPST